MNHLWAVLRGVVGGFGGYAAMGGLITLVQENWLGGVSYHTSSLTVLAVGGFFAFLSAVAGGFIASLIAPHRPAWVGIAMCALAVAETTWLIRAGRTDGPLWFDVAAAGSLLAGMMLGACWRSLVACCRRSAVGVARPIG